MAPDNGDDELTPRCGPSATGSCGRFVIDAFVADVVSAIWRRPTLRRGGSDQIAKRYASPSRTIRPAVGVAKCVPMTSTGRSA